MTICIFSLGSIGGQAGSGVGSLPVSPPASDQTPGGSFPLTKKAALLGSVLQTREALQLVRSPVRQQQTQTQTIAPRAVCVCVCAGNKRRVYLCHLDYFLQNHAGCSPSAIWSLMVIGHLN